VFSVLGVLADRKHFGWEQQQALLRVLIEEAQEYPEARLWRQVLLCAFVPMLMGIRARTVQGDHDPDDLDSTLTLHGIFYAYEVNDELVWAIAHGLERIFEQKLPAVPKDPAHKPRRRLQPHPAVVELLDMIDRLHPGGGDEPMPPGNRNA